MTELDALAAKLRDQFEVPLTDVGVSFKLGAVRRPGFRGVRRLLRLHVWPRDGFDNFEWVETERTWLGSTRTLMSLASIELAVSDVLRRYLAGGTPPFD